MIRTTDIVADRLGRVRPEKNRARVADAARQRLGVGALDLEVLRRDSIDERHRLLKRADHDDGTEIAPGGAGNLGARQACELRRHGALDHVRECLVVGDQDCLGAGIVLGLRQKVGRDPIRMAAAVGEDQYLRGTRDHIDADLAEHQPLGRRHVGVAGTDDFGNRGDGCGAVGERGHCLRAADTIDFVDAGQLRRRQHQRAELALRRRHHHDQARHARDLGRHRIHQDRGRIGRGAARHVEADCLDRGPAVAELDPERIGKTLVLGQLPAMISLDPLAGERKRIERAAVAGGVGHRNLGGSDTQAGRGEVDPIEFLGQLDQRLITARGHVGDDRAHGRFNIGRSLALGVEEGAKALGKIRRAGIEADRHGPVIDHPSAKREGTAGYRSGA